MTQRNSCAHVSIRGCLVSSPIGRRAWRARLPIFAFLCVLACAVMMSGRAFGQQSFQNISAAQPSPGVVLAREVVQYTKYRDDPAGRAIFDLTIETQIAIGLTAETAFIFRVPLKYREQDRAAMGGMPAIESDDLHFGDAHVMVKHRIWQNDTGPIDTQRISLIAGIDIPTGKAPFGNEGWDPMVGIVYTSIQGRHGVNAAARYQFNTHERDDGMPTTATDGIEDTAFLDLAYLYRMHPAEFAADSHGAWYLMGELNGTYETNGDIEFMFGPGIMYEARNWVIEASVQVPVAADVDHRPEIDYTIGVGLRILF